MDNIHKILSTFTFNYSHLILYKDNTIEVTNCNTKILSKKKKISQIEVYENTNVFFLLSSDRKRIYVWDVETNIISNIIVLDEEEEIKNYKVKNRLLIILLKNKVQIFSFSIEKDQNTGENILDFSKIILMHTYNSNEHEIKAFSVCLKPTSPCIAAFSVGKTIVLIRFNNENNIITKDIDTNGKTNLKFIKLSDDGLFIFYASENGKYFRKMDIDKPESIIKINRNKELQKKNVINLAISHDNMFLIALYVDGSFEYLDLRKNEQKSSNIISYVFSSFSSSSYSSNKIEKISPIPNDIVFPNESQCLYVDVTGNIKIKKYDSTDDWGKLL